LTDPMPSPAPFLLIVPDVRCWVQDPERAAAVPVKASV
jgi:hypothetical protein